MLALRSGSASRPAKLSSEASAERARASRPPGAAGGHWESVDLLADQRRLAGSAAGTSPMALAIMSDSDNSCQRAEAYYGGFRFSSAPSASASNRTESPGEALETR